METFNERIADDSIAHAVDLLKVGTNQSNSQVVKLLVLLESKLLAKISTSKISAGSSVEAPAVLALLDVIESLVDEYYGKISGKASATIADIVSIESKLLKKMFDPLDFSVLTKSETKKFGDSMLIAGETSDNWWARQAQSFKQRVSDTVRSTVAAGGGSQDVAEAFSAAGINTAASEGDALIKTAVTTASNDARMEMFLKNVDMFKGFQQFSTLDSRTSNICIAYSGAIWDVELQPVGHALPFNGGTPRHWRCRSFIVPIVKSFEDLGIDLPELPPAVRSSIDGIVPADTTYEEWLKKKSAAFQDTVLGSGTADLWRAGKINFSDLVDATGRHSLSLSELKAKVGAKR